MSIKSIPLKTWEVQAILENRKSTMRRVVKMDRHSIYKAACAAGRWSETFGGEIPNEVAEWYAREVAKPTYQSGDILWVRETWTTEGKNYFYRTDYATDWLEPCETLSGGYPNECRDYPGCDGCMRDCHRILWHPSIHMPKAAARLFLRVTAVRVERLQEITEAGARSEMGELYCPICGGEGFIAEFNSDSLGYMEIECPYCEDTTMRFENLWNSTIKPTDLPRYDWDANPWVWVVEFERCEKPEGWV